MTRPTPLLVMVLVGGWLAGCAAIQSQDAMKTERLLMASGFQMRLADSDAKLAQLERLPQRQVVPQPHEGRPFFVYADAKYCKCLYAGTERAYRRYERLALLKGIVDERRETAEAYEGAAMDIGTFGPWGPWL